MKKIFIFMLVTACSAASGQGNTLFHVSMVKPKIGQNGAFEMAWKAHVAKFHNGDDKRMVFEVISGEGAGYYHLVYGPSSYADMDKENPRKAEHEKDYNNIVAPKIEKDAGSFIFRLVDTLGYNASVSADHFSFSEYNVKLGKMPELTAEVKRAIQVYNNIKHPGTVSIYIKQMPGSSPQMVQITSLKDGFKQLEMNYFAGMTDQFRENYITTYSQAAWDRRMVLLQEITHSYHTYLVKRRKDLSSF